MSGGVDRQSAQMLHTLTGDPKGPGTCISLPLPREKRGTRPTGREVQGEGRCGELDLEGERSQGRREEGNSAYGERGPRGRKKRGLNLRGTRSQGKGEEGN